MSKRKLHRIINSLCCFRFLCVPFLPHFLYFSSRKKKKENRVILETLSLSFLSSSNLKKIFTLLTWQYTRAFSNIYRVSSREENLKVLTELLRRLIRLGILSGPYGGRGGGTSQHGSGGGWFRKYDRKK